MTEAPRRALYQSFLPTTGRTLAHVWKFSLEYGGRRPRHFHEEPELNLIVSGSGTFGVGETIVKAQAGELLAFPPGQDHALLEASPDLYLFAIGLSPDFSAQVLRSDRDSIAIPSRVRLARDEFKSVAARAAVIVDQAGVENLGAELWEHAAWLRKRSSTWLGHSMHVLTRRTLSALADAPELERGALAKALRASPYAISRYFHHDVGMTLVRYRTRLRLLRMIRLMDGGKQSVSVAASAAGFGSYSQCHRVFQSEFGCSPRTFFETDLRERMQLAYEP